MIVSLIIFAILTIEFVWAYKLFIYKYLFLWWLLNTKTDGIVYTRTEMGMLEYCLALDFNNLDHFPEISYYSCSLEYKGKTLIWNMWEDGTVIQNYRRIGGDDKEKLYFYCRREKNNNPVVKLMNTKGTHHYYANWMFKKIIEAAAAEQFTMVKMSS